MQLSIQDFSTFDALQQYNCFIYFKITSHYFAHHAPYRLIYSQGKTRARFALLRANVHHSCIVTALGQEKYDCFAMQQDMYNIRVRCWENILVGHSLLTVRLDALLEANTQHFSFGMRWRNYLNCLSCCMYSEKICVTLTRGKLWLLYVTYNTNRNY